MAIERHGEKPVIKCLSSTEEELVEIKKLLIQFKDSEHKSLGIICKIQTQAEQLKEQLSSISSYGMYLLTSQSASFAEGIIITTAHMAKGLEFDSVIIPSASAANYNTHIDKNMLYIACTRAMHKLYLTCVKEVSPFIHRNFP